MDIDLLYIGIVLGVILISMTLHEVMHGYMAYFLGDDTAKMMGRLTLNPIKHIDPVLTIILPVILAISGGPIFGGAKPVPFNPARLKYDEWGSALVAIAGPLTNLLIAFVSFGLLVLLGSSSNQIVSQILMTCVQVNIGFFVFNMIPFPPLDGSRVLYALAPEFVRRGMEVLEQFGIVIIFVLVVIASPFISIYMRAAINGIIGLFSAIFMVG